jgi:tetratricopeptide (TPR) repeat protein
MAPEQTEGKAVDPRTDVYALGAILYHLLTGRPPFQASSSLETLEQVRTQDPVPPGRLQPGMARDLETICLKCLQKDPAKRYGTALALADDLQSFLQGCPISARPVSAVEHAWRWCRRKPAVAGLAATLVLAVAGGLSASIVLWQRAETQATRAQISETEARASLHTEQIARQETEEHLARLREMLAAVNSPSAPQSILMEHGDPLREATLRETEECLSPLIQRRESDRELRASLAGVFTRLGAICLSKDRETEAQSYLERAAELWEQLRTGDARTPKDLAWQAITYAYLVQTYERQGRTDRAQQSFASAFRIWQELVREPPDASNRAVIIKAVLTVGDVLLERHSPEGLARGFARVRGRLERLGGGPECDLFFDLVRVAYWEAEAERREAGGQSTAVVAAAREAASLLKSLLAQPALHRNTRCQLAHMAIVMSMYLRRGGAAAEALALCDKIDRTLRELAKEAPKESPPFQALSDTWHEIAKVRWSLNQTEETILACRQALQMQRKVFALAPAALGSSQELGERYAHLGRKLCELGRLAEAEACFHERQALWPGDIARYEEALRDLRKWAAQVGDNKDHLSPEEQQERQRYLDLCARLERHGLGMAAATGVAQP